LKYLASSFSTEVNRYYKIECFRIIIEIANLKSDLLDDTIIKYINEQFHVENDYLFGLDMKTFNVVPSYYIKHCEEYLARKKVI